MRWIIFLTNFIIAFEIYLHSLDIGSTDTRFHPLMMCVLYTWNSNFSLSYLGYVFPIHFLYIWILLFLMKF